MRYIVVRTVSTETGINFEGLIGLIQKPSGIFPDWANLRDVKTNCRDSRQCGLLSFDDPDELDENLERWDLGETVGILGVKALTEKAEKALNET